MKTHTVTTYNFDELSDKFKEKAIEKHYDINVDYDWWQFVYEDAEEIGLKITAFDIDRASYVTGKFIEYAINTANKIIANHGEETETYKDAYNFIIECNRLQVLIDVEDELWGKYHYELEEAEREFLKSLCEDYRIMLTHEYEYLTSEVSIIETLKSNDYEFYDNGTLY